MNFMNEIKTVGVKELKNKLSSYLREVRAGVRVLVSDRGTVVAELHRPYAGQGVDLDPAAILAEWAQTGAVRLPTSPKHRLPRSPVSLPGGSARSLLRKDRKEARE